MEYGGGSMIICYTALPPQGNTIFMTSFLTVKKKNMLESHTTRYLNFMIARFVEDLLRQGIRKTMYFG